MFQYCNRLKQGNLSSFDTSHVRSMGQMFADCGAIQKLDLGNFDTSSVANGKSLIRTESGFFTSQASPSRNFSIISAVRLKWVVSGGRSSLSTQVPIDNSLF